MRQPPRPGATTDGPAPRTPNVDDAGAGSTHRLLRPFRPLAFREYRFMWLGQSCQAGSMWAERVARSVLIYQLTGSAVQLAGAEAMRGFAMLLLGAWGGVLADRLDKRALLMMVQFWAFAVYSTIAVLALTGHLQVWHLYASTFGLSLGQAVNQPVRTSMIPTIVPRDLVLGALTLNAMAVNASRMVTPVATGLLIAVTRNGGWGYAIGSVLYFLMMLFTMQLRGNYRAGDEKTLPFLKSLAEGIRYVGRERVVLAQMVIAYGPLSFAFAYQAILIVYVHETLGGGAGMLSLLFFFTGFGALFGGFNIGTGTLTLRQGRILFIAGVVDGAALMLLGAAGWLPAAWLAFAVAALCMIGVGATQVSFMSTNNSLLLVNTPSNLRGRVMGLTVFRQVVMAGAAFLGGIVAELTNGATALATLGACCIAIVVGVTLWQPRILQLDGSRDTRAGRASPPVA